MYQTTPLPNKLRNKHQTHIWVVFIILFFINEVFELVDCRGLIGWGTGWYDYQSESGWNGLSHLLQWVFQQRQYRGEIQRAILIRSTHISFSGNYSQGSIWIIAAILLFLIGCGIIVNLVGLCETHIKLLYSELDHWSIKVSMMTGRSFWYLPRSG